MNMLSYHQMVDGILIHISLNNEVLFVFSYIRLFLFVAYFSSCDNTCFSKVAQRDEEREESLKLTGASPLFTLICRTRGSRLSAADGLSLIEAESHL